MEWIDRIDAINTYINIMSDNARSLTDEEIIDRVIEPNFPEEHQNELELERSDTDDLDDIKEKLIKIFRQEQIRNKQNRRRKGKSNSHHRNQHFQNECKKHGGHAWADCLDNPQKHENNHKHQDKENSSYHNRRGRIRSRSKEHHAMNQSESSDSKDSQSLYNTIYSDTS